MVTSRTKYICHTTIALLLAIGVLAACRTLARTPEPDQLILQLNWSHEVEFAGYYVADERGFYADENIAVTILERDFSTGPEVALHQLVNQEIDLAVLSFSLYKSDAAPERQAVAIMAVQQIPPTVLFALSDSGIQRPQDMVGRRVAVKSEFWGNIIRDTLSNAGVDPADIIEVEVESDAIEMLYDGQVDVWTGFAHDEPTEARLAGYDLNLIYTGDYGVGAYGGLLAVRQGMIDQNPDLAARFVRASLKGWQYAVEHPDEAAEIVARWQPDESLEFHRIAIRSLIPLVDTLEAPIGWIDAERWQVAMGKTYTPERPGYTMQFVEAAQE